MTHQVGMDYYGYGNRKDMKPEGYTLSNKAIKDSAHSLIERNYLMFDNNTHRYASIPEYKRYRQVSDMNYKVNDYLNPVNQFKYTEDPLSHSALDNQLYSLQKTKKYIDLGNEKPSSEKISSTPSERLILKESINENILRPNYLHLKSNEKFGASLSSASNRHKTNSYIESKESPEYLRLYDKERLSEIDKYYINRNQNLSVLSRFGNWITVTPHRKDRKHCLEKQKQGQYETSIVAPQWMEIKRGEAPANLFRSVQWKNTCKDKTKVTILIDRNQKEALPYYLLNSYDRYKYTN